MVSRLPFGELILNHGDEYNQIVATKGEDYVMVYTPLGDEIVLYGNMLPVASYKAWWFDPRSGKSQFAGNMDKKPVLHFISPSRGPGFDWVLVLDEAGRNH
jgi:hypothetical protein